MKIAICQSAGRPGRVDENLALMEQAAAEAADRGARLVIYPELFLTGYNLGTDLLDLAEPADGPGMQAAAQIAREKDIALLYGYPERAAGGIFNSALLLNGGGKILANCRKTHLYGVEEKRLFEKGDRLAAANLEGITIGLLICYDVEFPEAVRSLTLAGADLIAVPTALMKPFCRIIDTLIPTRAYENQVYVAYANRCGSEGKMDYCGRSTVAGPDGIVTARAGIDAQMIYTDIDRAAIEAARRDNPVLSDLRPDLYRRSAAVQSSI